MRLDCRAGSTELPPKASHTNCMCNRRSGTSNPSNHRTTEHLPAGLSVTEAPRPVADGFPWGIWLVTAVEVCDRFAFFGLGGPLQNYLQNSRGDRLHPGLGQTGATAVNQVHMLWCFLMPLLGSVIADQYWGRVPTVTNASIVYICGSVMVVTSSQL
ncbi:hypothetical protein F5Y14DRAFT_462656 [Nemania sp. NC0429]|nr:hypothetical protein F5Y14DRAFT_462656 [Nemania sp. NC0429]